MNRPANEEAQLPDLLLEHSRKADRVLARLPRANMKRRGLIKLVYAMKAGTGPKLSLSVDDLLGVAAELDEISRVTATAIRKQIDGSPLDQDLDTIIGALTGGSHLRPPVFRSVTAGALHTLRLMGQPADELKAREESGIFRVSRAIMEDAAVEAARGLAWDLRRFARRLKSRQP